MGLTPRAWGLDPPLCAADESFRDANCLPSENQKKEIMGFIAYMLYVQLMKL